MSRRMPGVAILALGLLAGCTQPERGAWWYRHGAGDSYGIQSVLFDATGALTPGETIDAIEGCGARRLYGSYGAATAPAPGGALTAAGVEVASFNAELHARGMQSQYLISDGAAPLLDGTALLAKVQERVLDFNAAAGDPAQRFDAVHLDIEPQTASECKLVGGDPPACHALFQALLLLVADVDLQVQAAGQDVAIHVDLPVWLDVLPSEDPGAKVGWPAPDAESRDLWYQALADRADGITLMAYGEGDPAELWDSVGWEALHFAGEVRVGLDHESGGTFPDWTSLDAMASLLGVLGVRIDLHDVNDIQAAGGCLPAAAAPPGGA